MKALLVALPDSHSAFTQVSTSPSIIRTSFSSSSLVQTRVREDSLEMEARSTVVDVLSADGFFRSLPPAGRPRRPDPATLVVFENPELSAVLAQDERYCPIIECGFAKKVYVGRLMLPAAAWLEAEWAPLLLILPSAFPLATWHRMVVARWRLFEANFGVPLAWHGFEPPVARGPPQRLPFRRHELGAYYVAAYKYYSTGNECTACRAVEWGPCTAFNRGELRGPYPQGICATGTEFPNTRLFTEEQMMSWSLAVGFISLVVMGKILGDSRVADVGYDLLARWEAELTRRLCPR